MELEKLTHLIPWLLGHWRPSGLLIEPPDPRNFNANETFGWGLFGYTPKHQKLRIETEGVLDQKQLECCQWYAAAIQDSAKGKGLKSPRSLVIKGRQLGLTQEAGLSAMGSAQKVRRNWGVCDESVLPTMYEENYEVYSNSPLTPDQNANAATHKEKTDWWVQGKNGVIEALDNGCIIETGIDWFTGFNQSGGFSSPWLIKQALGYKVGGHAVAIVGYDLNYQGYQVFDVQNSYSALWGDQGHFYITMDYLVGHNYGFIASVDIPYQATLSTQDIIDTLNARCVKGDNNPECFFIWDGVKQSFVNKLTMNAYGYTFDDLVVVPQASLDGVPLGNPMDIKLSPNWQAYQTLKDPANLAKLIQYLNQTGYSAK